MVYFFALVYFLAYRTQSYGPFWPILAILSQIYALFDVLFTGLNNVAMYQNGRISGMTVGHINYNLLVLYSYISLYISAHPDGNWIQTQSMQSSPKLKISFWPLIAVAFLSYSQSNATANIVWTLNFSKRNVWNCRNLRYWFSSNFTSKAYCFIINFRSLGGFDIDIDTTDKIYWKSHHRHIMPGFLTSHLFFHFL